jgi:hypothetical protein
MLRKIRHQGAWASCEDSSCCGDGVMLVFLWGHPIVWTIEYACAHAWHERGSQFGGLEFDVGLQYP